ncbi:accessory gene regulator ArgB-like protein [Paenibacillus durus]|nr:accessory gene regulator B family protein [Paenibacillus durus]
MANKIAVAIKRANPEDTSSIEVMEYSLGIILNALLTFAVSSLIGWLLGNFEATLTFMLCFNLLRLCSGGFHLKTATACNIASTLIYSFTPYFFAVSGTILWTMNAVSLIMMILFAPNPDKNAQIPVKWFPYLKCVSILLVCFNFWIESSNMALAFFIQSLTIIPWERRL